MAPQNMHAEIIYPWTEDPIPIVLSEDLNDRLTKLRQLVRGDLLQVIALTNDTYLCIREDAKLHAHIKNNTATRIAHEAGTIAETDYIAGTAVMFPRCALP